MKMFKNINFFLSVVYIIYAFYLDKTGLGALFGAMAGLRFSDFLRAVSESRLRDKEEKS
jgi:hypothetical protein